MATSNSDDLKTVASPLDLSLKVVNISKTIEEEEDSIDKKSPEDHKSVSSEEILSLKLLHDRLRKTMEMLLPEERLKKYEEISKCHLPPSMEETSEPEFDYRTTMRALLSLVESGNVQSHDDDDRNMTSLPQSKVPVPQVDSWSYWHDYIVSLYLMNSTGASSVPPAPPIPAPPLPLSSISASLFTPPFNFPAASPNSILFQNMFNNLINRNSSKSQDDANSRFYLPNEGSNPDFGYKNKKLSSYQFLKDSSLLYNSFAASRNLGLSKTKLLDSPESFGVSLRGNQKYSIYYQQRPNNIFNNNNNFLTPNLSSSMCTKPNHTTNYRSSLNCGGHFLKDDNTARKMQNPGEKKNEKDKIHKSLHGTDSRSGPYKVSQDKHNKSNNSKNGSYKNSCNLSNNTSGNNSLQFESVLPNLHLVNRYKETVFNCSCGQEFENLYAFTIHMKSTNHIPPNSSKIERSIPKLVRGQDMWINSETEQTKEILRCMRCQQSFRTLPELTMHMVETNHYSEIVYSDTGKYVFLNSDHDKGKASYTTINSPRSSPSDIIRKLKRTLSSSTGSDIGVEEDNCKKIKISSPIEPHDDDSKPSIDTESLKPEDSEVVDTIKCEEVLQIKEADSATIEPQPDTDRLTPLKLSKIVDNKESVVNSTNSCDSVIRQIENFVEKSLPKPAYNEYNINSSVFSNNLSNQRTVRSVNKGVSSKSNAVERAWKAEAKSSSHEKTEAFLKQNDKSKDTFNYKNYHVSSSDNLENPLSSLQTLVETIQKNNAQSKDQGANNCKAPVSQSKDASSFSYSSKSPVVCDSLSQLQALVAGTSVANTSNHSSMASSKPNEFKHLSFSSNEKYKLPNHDVNDTSATFLSWCHKLGELLGLPQSLSQAMLTQDAIKDLTNSVLMMNNQNLSSAEATNEGTDNNLSKIELAKAVSSSSSASDSELKVFQGRDSDPLEQLKNLLQTASDSGQSNHSQVMSKKFLNGSNPHSNTSPAISKKAKCHFCNKPFANKGQVRLHISKGKCPSLMRSCHSSGNQPDPVPNRTVSPVDSKFSPLYKFKDTSANDTLVKSDFDTNSKDNSIISNKSVNLIREYFKFAKKMIGNDEGRETPANKIENKID